MIDLSIVKQKLLDSGCFEDNNYLIFYLELIKNNIKTKKQKCKTNRHHIIPRCYFKFKKLEIDNSENNLVNLLYKDHILAHYYLCLCCSNVALKYKLESSLQYVLDTYDVEKSFVLEIKNLEECQKLYEDRKKYFSDIQKGQIGKTLGRIAINKDNKQKFITKEDVEIYLKDGWKIGALPYSKPRVNPMLGKHHSEETKKKIAQKHIGKEPWNKGKSGKKWSDELKIKQSNIISRLRAIHLDDSTEKRVPEEQLNYWLNLGWKIGRCKNSIMSTSKNNASSIYCIETKKRYNSLREFCRQLNVQRNCRLLKKHLTGEVDSYYGYHLK